MPRKILVAITTILISLFLTAALAPAPLIPYSSSLYLPIVSKTDPSNQSPSGVQILPNQSTYTDVFNTFHILGEVKNYTTHTLEFVEIIADFYDAANSVVGNGFTFIYLDNLPPGQKTCFNFRMDLPAGYSYYKFEPVSYHTDGSPNPNLTLLSHSGSYNTSSGWFELTGEVRNDDSTSIRYVSPIATYYQANGTVIGCDFTYLNAETLYPGQSSTFKFHSTGNHLENTASYSLQLDGTP